MKKYLLLVLFSIGISTLSYSQQGSEKTGGFLARIFSGGKKIRKQMFHFDKRRRDPNLKHNGTSYLRNRKRDYKVDGNGYSTNSQGKRRRGKKSGLK